LIPLGKASLACGFTRANKVQISHGYVIQID